MNFLTPNRISNDLIFAVYQNRGKPNPKNLYHDLGGSFTRSLDRSGKGNWEGEQIWFSQMIFL